jgi:hypothetical protein
MTDHFVDANKKVYSPAAQEVLNAYRDKSWTPDEEDNDRYYKFSHKAGMAAALRAVAQHLYHDWSAFNCIDALNEIAQELEELPE